LHDESGMMSPGNRLQMFFPNTYQTGGISVKPPWYAFSLFVECDFPASPDFP